MDLPEDTFVNVHEFDSTTGYGYSTFSSIAFVRRS